ncbi:MAG: hypothetical protein AXA67_04105 [Methylothermaceae bacteria B42]|nr:MAG: hypothetical protein AXA67_04105 [Methylothermaceae bacteria B42]HHJ38627.1 heavy metal-responsive transcriptional regulator [Methylothermaceae bacterium]
MSKGYPIGQVAALLGVTVDTLRYYEKIGLLPPVSRDSGGRRRYDQDDLVRFRFIQRAKKMDFTLAEIAELLKLRTEPLQAKGEIQRLVRQKLSEIDNRMHELAVLRSELDSLLNQCQSDSACCPIVSHMEEGDKG